MTSATDNQPTIASTVLVAYGSKNGSTAGIAEMIATALHNEGLDAGR
jgi:menaquinone-dependent protoporphyrinogen IX oxidase